MCLLKNKGSKWNYSICSDKLTKADKEIEKLLSEKRESEE